MMEEARLCIHGLHGKRTTILGKWAQAERDGAC